MNAAKFLTILRPKGGGAPPEPTWADAVTDIAPPFWWGLNGDFTNSGTVGGTVTGIQGSPSLSQVGIVSATSAIGVTSGQGFSRSLPTYLNSTVILLVKPPASLNAVTYVAAGGGSLLLRVLANGTLQIYDDAFGGNIATSATGVMKPDQWNMVVYQPRNSGSTKIYHTSQDSAGIVSEVASGGTCDAAVESGTVIRGSANADTAFIDEVVITGSVLDLTALQTLADTLDWS